MSDSKTKSELSKIAKSNSIPPFVKQALYAMLREEIGKIRMTHEGCTYVLKCDFPDGVLPVIRLIPCAARNSSAAKQNSAKQKAQI